METDVFKRNVTKTVAAKSVKLGMRVASKSTVRVNVAHAAVSLKRDVGNLIHGLGPYVLGLQMNQEMKESAFKSMGDIGADLAVLCKTLKVKMPTATKKVKLVGTRTAALLQLDSVTTDMLALVERGVFSAPQMTHVKKMVVMPMKGGVKEEREVEVVDANAEATMEEERMANMRSLLASAVDLYWRLCYNILEQTPAAVFAAKFERMKQEYPHVEFDLGKADEEAPEEQAAPETVQAAG